MNAILKIQHILHCFSEKPTDMDEKLYQSYLSSKIFTVKLTYWNDEKDVYITYDSNINMYDVETVKTLVERHFVLNQNHATGASSILGLLLIQSNKILENNEKLISNKLFKLIYYKIWDTLQSFTLKDLKKSTNIVIQNDVVHLYNTDIPTEETTMNDTIFDIPYLGNKSIVQLSMYNFSKAMIKQKHDFIRIESSNLTEIVTLNLLNRENINNTEFNVFTKASTNGHGLHSTDMAIMFDNKGKILFTNNTLEVQKKRRNPSDHNWEWIYVDALKSTLFKKYLKWVTLNNNIKIIPYTFTTYPIRVQKI